MHDHRFVSRLFWLCCVVLLPMGVWGDHPPGGGRRVPQTPAQEQARQMSAMGMKYLLQKDYRQAIQAFQVAAQLDPEDAVIYFEWGVALGGLGEHQQEIEKYEQAVRYNPAFGHAYVAWAATLLQLGREAEARAKVKQARAIAPGTLEPVEVLLLKSLGLLE